LGFVTSAFLIVLSYASINGLRHLGEPDKHMVCVLVSVYVTMRCCNYIKLTVNFSTRSLQVCTSGLQFVQNSVTLCSVTVCGRLVRPTVSS
jgi:hypothetical protein